MKHLINLLFTLTLLTQAGFAQSAEDLFSEGKRLVEAGNTNFDLPTLMKARSVFERLASANPGDMNNEYYLAYSDYRLAVYSYSKNDKNSLLKNLEKSIEGCKSIITKNPMHAEALALLSTLYGLKISTDWSLASTLGPESHANLQKAITIDPENPRVVMHMGISKFNTPDFFGGSKKEAHNLFLQSVDLFHKSNSSDRVIDWGIEDAYAWLGQSYADSKNYEKAIETYNTALTINPDYGWIKYQLLPSVEKKLSQDR